MRRWRNHGCGSVFWLIICVVPCKHGVQEEDMLGLDLVWNVGRESVAEVDLRTALSSLCDGSFHHVFDLHGLWRVQEVPPERQRSRNSDLYLPADEVAQFGHTTWHDHWDCSICQLTKAHHFDLMALEFDEVLDLLVHVARSSNENAFDEKQELNNNWKQMEIVHDWRN